MPVRGLLARLLRWLGVLCTGALVVLGGLGLQPAGRVAVGVAGLLAGCIAVGITRDIPRHDRRPVLESAVQAAGWTVGGLLALAGVAVLTGGVVAVLTGVLAVGAWLLVRVAGSSRRHGRAPGGASGAEVLRLPVDPQPSPGAAGTSLSSLSTPALGREWIRTTAALGAQLSPVERQALVRRREETLDELERRDPAGFARWLAEGPALGTDPADYVQGRPVQGDPAAGTDAA
ncbi:hypothetical protein [Blastococcus litoris]|uniref:hypothetical protein n=1 Tax=Blastococcus litoris TaxID=2171622 RepID=UPI000E2FFFA2|nr:hypothetical protein [Blastococcus litoris]